MAFTAVLVDQARMVSRAKAGPRVEGTTRLVTTQGPWFRARLFLADAPQDTSDGRPRTVASPQLLYGLRDLDGNGVLLNANQRVEVASAQLGNALWELTGDPEPIRKRRSLIGYQANLTRVEEHEVAL